VDLRDKKILVTGGNGFVGTSLVKNLSEIRNVPSKNIFISDAKTDDLRIYDNCELLIKNNDIDVVIHLAAVIGGIGYSDTHSAEQYYSNILMDLQIVEAAKNCGVERVLLVGSSSSYSKDVPQPIKEDYLWDGLPQESNLSYGISKRLMTVQAAVYKKQFGLNISVVIPNNGYGPYSNFHPEYSNVVASIIRRINMRESSLIVWGDGTATRDFLYVKDFAEGILLATEKLQTGEYINLGSGVETSIKDLVMLIKKLSGYKGKIVFDASKPGGPARRSIDISKAKKLIGFEPKYTLEHGLRETIDWYIKFKDKHILEKDPSQ
jgi:GDP-L-fucose synthase